MTGLPRAPYGTHLAVLALASAPIRHARLASTSASGCRQLRAGFGELVPALFGALVILFAGYLLAKVLEKRHRAVPAAHAAQPAARARRRDAGGRAVGVAPQSDARASRTCVFWFVMFAVILVAANALGLESLANVFSELVSYIPSVIAAIVIIIVGIVLGGFVGGLIMASAGALHGGPTLARVGRGGVILLADLHGAAGARHRDGHRHDGVRDPVRRGRAGDGAGVRARQPRAGGRGHARVVRAVPRASARRSRARQRGRGRGRARRRR